MDSNLITALAGVLGSVSGASAAIGTTWISQKSQTVRERAKSETRKRETLYGDFITEASHLMANAFDHSLDKPESFTPISAVFGFFPPTLFSRRPKHAATAFLSCTQNPIGQWQRSPPRYTVASLKSLGISATPVGRSCVSTPRIKRRRPRAVKPANSPLIWTDEKN